MKAQSAPQEGYAILNRTSEIIGKSPRSRRSADYEMPTEGEPAGSKLRSMRDIQLQIRAERGEEKAYCRKCIKSLFNANVFKKWVRPRVYDEIETFTENEKRTDFIKSKISERKNEFIYQNLDK